MNILLLGGTTEASELATRMAGMARLRATLSYAGRTSNPIIPAIPYRIGGFGGAEGLARWLEEHDVTALVDATHPFARRMGFNAQEAAGIAAIPLLKLLRPAWKRQPGDDWTEVETHAEALAALGKRPKRVFLTVGRLELAAYAAAMHRYVVRSVDPLAAPYPLANAQWIAARGPFRFEDERALLQEHGIEVVVTKNSGGNAAIAKLAAARELGIPVILLKRPPAPDVPCAATADEAMRWILRVHGASS